MAPMKSSALRRWLREERGRENAEALAAGVDIAPTAAEPLHLEGLTSIDLGTPWPSLRPGHRLIDTWPACTVSNLPDHPLTAEHLGHAVRDLEAMARGEAAYRPLAYFGLEARPPTFLPRVYLDDMDDNELYVRDLAKLDPAIVWLSGGDPDPKT